MAASIFATIGPAMSVSIMPAQYALMNEALCVRSHRSSLPWRAMTLVNSHTRAPCGEYG